MCEGLDTLFIEDFEDGERYQYRLNLYLSQIHMLKPSPLMHWYLAIESLGSNKV